MEYLVEVEWTVTSFHVVEADSPQAARYAVGDKLDQEQITLQAVLDEEETIVNKHIENIEEN